MGLRAARWARVGLASAAHPLIAAVLIAGAGVGAVASVQAAVERYGYDPIGRLVQFVDPANQVTEYTYDPAGNLTSVTGGGNAADYAPVLASITPNFIRRGQTKSIVIAGQRLQSGTLQTSDGALVLANVRQTATQLTADLTAGASVPLGMQTLTYTNAAGTASAAITVAPVLPVLSAEPSPLALPPDNLGHPITLRLSAPDLVAHTVNLSFSDTSKATIAPASISFAAGQTEAQVTVTSKAAGFSTLQLSSTTLQTTSVPVYISADFKGINTSIAAPVGVVVGEANPSTPQTTRTIFRNPHVGVVLGSALSGVAPRGMPVNSVHELVISGYGIPANATVALLPAAGASLGAPLVASDGSRISVRLGIDAAAAAGARSVVVRDGTGKVISFAGPAQSQVVFTAGQPTLVSVEPLFGKPGSLMELKVRGANLHNASVALLPGSDIAIDNQPTINASGTELAVRVQLYPLAATGARVVQITTPSGQSSAVPSSANQFTLVSDIKNDITPIVAQAVGVVVGASNTDPGTNPQTITPVAAPSVGVVTGSVATSVSPKVAVVGTTVNLVVRGVGLQAVRSVALLSPEGLTPSAFSVNAEGTTLTLSVAVDAGAAKTPRKVVLVTATGRLPFVNESESSFLVAAPAPEIVSIAPQVIKAGTNATLTVRGKNFRDVLGVRFEPADGVAPLQGISASADGTVLTVPVSAPSTAATGARTLIVVTAGGESNNLPTAANTVQVARQISPSYADLSAPLVGVRVGSVVIPPEPTEALLAAPLVGVVVDSPTPPASTSRLVAASHVGVLLGTAATRVSPATPDGFLAGSSGVLTVTGTGLDAVTGIGVVGTSGIAFGVRSVNADGTQLTVPVTVAGTVPSGRYGIRLTQTRAGVTGRVTTEPAAALAFSVGTLPTQIHSMGPIVLEQGKDYTMVVRGTNLQDVYQLQTEPANGLLFGAPQWSTDALGEKLSVPLVVDRAASIGSRVVRLGVPGGLTSNAATPATTVTVVPPQ
jgi:YD repeat-containing protein